MKRGAMKRATIMSATAKFRSKAFIGVLCVGIKGMPTSITTRVLFSYPSSHRNIFTFFFILIELGSGYLK